MNRNYMKKRLYCIVLNTIEVVCLLIGTVLILACGRKTPDEMADFQPVSIEEVHVTIPDMEGEKKIYFLSDLHLIVENDEVDEEQREFVHDRVQAFMDEGKLTVSALDVWPDWVDYLNASDADYLLFGGDMVDFASHANVEAFGEGLHKLTIPWMYVRADHDTEPFYLAGVEKEDSVSYQNAIAPNEDVFVQDFDDFCIVGWNNSTSQLTENGLARMKEIFANDKPIILLTHVPIAPLVTDSLAEASAETWGDRALMWGEGCYHYPDDTTREFLQMIYAENTPVKEILSGHLHFTWDGMVTEQVHQHVFSPAFGEVLGVITLSGE